MQVNQVARNIESGWKGKIRRLYTHNDEQMAEMVGIDEMSQAFLFLTDDEALSEDDVQFHAVNDLVPCKTVEAV